jgi:anti-sigma B factor antagonist
VPGTLPDHCWLSSASLDGGTPVVEVRGELDLIAAPKLSRRLLDATSKRGGDVVLDLSEATFVDSTTLGVLVGTARRLARHRARLVVVASHPHIVRVFELTGLHRVLTLVASREQAQTAL